MKGKILELGLGQLVGRKEVVDETVEGPLEGWQKEVVLNHQRE